MGKQGIPLSVPGLDVGAPGEQQIEGGDVSAPAGKPERRPPVGVARLQLGALGQQQLDDGRPPSQRGDREGGPLARSQGGEAGTSSEGVLDCGDVTTGGAAEEIDLGL